MSDDRRKEAIAAAAVAMAQRNIAIAAARYGYVPPERHTAAPVASTPAPAPASMNNDALVKEAARRRAEREAAEAADIKASWARVAARMNGTETKDPSHLQHGWDKVVAEMNKRNGAVATEEKLAELTGWAKVIAQMNARGGR